MHMFDQSGEEYVSKRAAAQTVMFVVLIYH